MKIMLGSKAKSKDGTGSEVEPLLHYCTINCQTNCFMTTKHPPSHYQHRVPTPIPAPNSKFFLEGLWNTYSTFISNNS